MNKVFCMDCGFKNSYEVSTPKFCGNCGKSLNVSIANTPEKDSQEESEKSFSVGNVNIENLKRGIHIDFGHQKLKLDDLWRNPAPREQGFSRPKKGFGAQGAELLKQIEAECAPSTRHKEVE